MGMIINPYRVAPAVVLPVGAQHRWAAENNMQDDAGVYNGTAVAPAYATGIIGNAFSFDGTADKVITLPSINIGSTYSVDFWVYVESTMTAGASYDILGNAFSATTTFGSYDFQPNASVNASVLRFLIGSAANVNFQRANKGQWYKITITYDGTTIRHYVNHLLVGSFNPSAHNYNNTLKIGSVVTSPSNRLIGKIDELTLYNTAITPALTGNLVASWDCSSRRDSASSWDVIDDTTPLYGDGADGSANGAWAFNGADANRRYMPAFPSGVAITSWTLELKLFPATGSNGSNRSVLYALYNATNFGGLIRESAGTFTAWSNGAQVFSGAGSSPQNTWTTVKLTYNGSDQKHRLYINGVLAATQSGTTSSAAARWPQAASGTTSFPRFGESHGFYPLNAWLGRMDDVKFYNAVV